MTLLDLDIAPPPSYKRFIELEDNYILARHDASVGQIRDHIKTKQKVYLACWKEILEGKGKYGVPSGLVSGVVESLEQIISGEPPRLFYQGTGDGGRPEFYQYEATAIEYALSYVVLCTNKLNGFNSKSPVADVAKAFGVTRGTVHKWKGHPRFQNIIQSPLPLNDWQSAKNNLQVMGEIYLNGYKGHAREKAGKKTGKKRGV